MLINEKYIIFEHFREGGLKQLGIYMCLYVWKYILKEVEYEYLAVYQEVGGSLSL